MVPAVIAASSAAGPLPPSWNAHRHALAALGLALDPVDCYGFAGGLGFLYVRAPAPLLLGFGSLDPMEELAIAVGAWVDQRHSIDRAAAVARMREHLAREQTPVIVPLRPEPGDDVETAVGPSRPQETVVSVSEIGDDRVVCLRGPGAERRELPLAAWLDRLADHGRRWSIILSNGRFTEIRQRLRSSLRHCLHRLAAGWRGRLGGLTALEVFCADLRHGPLDGTLDATLRASAQLGGGMGRGLFARFVARHAELLPGCAARLACHLGELDSAWRGIEARLAERSRPSAAELRHIHVGEAASLVLLSDVASAWKTAPAAMGPC